MAKEFKIIGVSLLIGMSLSLLIAARMVAYSEKNQADIASQVIRFHVKANSDLPEDQSLKNAVRDGVLSAFESGLSAANSVDETRQFIAGNIAAIIACAQEVVYEWGYDYPVSGSMEKRFFPTRVYGYVVFPPGEYEALSINIGDGAGSNWWCIMFPPLCYVDMTRDIPANEKQQLMHLIPEEGYKLLTHMEQDDAIKVKFKIVEWWQNRKEPVEAEEQYAINP